MIQIQINIVLSKISNVIRKMRLLEMILREKRILRRHWWETVYRRITWRISVLGASGKGIQRADSLTFFSRFVYRDERDLWSVSVEIPRCAASSFLLEKPDACRFIANIYLLKRRCLEKHLQFVAYKTSDDEHTIQRMQQEIN